MNKLRGLPYWLTDKYIYIMLFAYPLFSWYKGYVHLTTAKFVFFAVITGLWLLGLAAAVIKSRLRLGKPSLAQWFALGYLALCLLSAVCSKFFLSSLVGEGRFDGLVTIFMTVLIFLGVSGFARPKKGYLVAMALSAGLCCAVAVVQLFGVNFLGLFPGSYTYYGGGYEYTGEFLSPIGNADLFSAYMCLCIPLFSVYYISSEKRGLWLLPLVALCCFVTFVCRVSAGKLALGVCLLAMLPVVVTSPRRLRRTLELGCAVCLGLFAAVGFGNVGEWDNVKIAFTVGKMGLIILAGAAICFAASLFAEKLRLGKKTLRFGFIALDAIIVLAGFYVVYSWRGTEGTIYELSQLLHGKADDSFGSSRIRIWRETLALFSERPLLGGGPGTLALRLDIFFERWVEESGKTLSGSVDNAHNVYLGVMINTGSASLAAYLAMLSCATLRALKKGSALALALSAGLICYFVQDFFGLGLFIVSPVMYILLGLAASRRKEMN